MIIDEYDLTCGNKAIMINGSVNFIERGSKLFELYKIFEKKIFLGKEKSMERKRGPFCSDKN